MAHASSWVLRQHSEGFSRTYISRFFFLFPTVSTLHFALLSLGRAAKRPRKALTAAGALGAPAGLKQPPQSPRDDDDNDNWSQWRKRFLQLFEDPVAKDIVWWLPGRRGEAFAMQRERFEKEGLFQKMQFSGRSFSDFLEKLNRWYVFS